ncbi:MAG: cell filamentation protein Fic [Treponematales bacterium]
MTDFESYIRQGEPSQVEKARNWRTAIGLQAVDGLKPSAYLLEQASLNIEGAITIAEVKNRIDAYYQTQSGRQSDGDRTEEADKVSARITEILSEKTFSFSPPEYMGIHKRLFGGIYKFAGRIRDYNITKAEWVLDGETVLYGTAENLKETLDYDFNQEKNFNYRGLTQEEVVEHIAHFTAYLWQIHVFGEGNTRTTAVFLIKYLRHLGFKNVNNDLFAEHSWYFRNALVRANFQDLGRGIQRDEKYLVRFFANVLLGHKNELKNRYLHIKAATLFPAAADDGSGQKTENGGQKRWSETEKGGQKADDGGQKKWSETIAELLRLLAENPNITRKELSEALHINPSAIQKHIAKLKKAGVLTRTGSDRKGTWVIKDGQP